MTASSSPTPATKPTVDQLFTALSHPTRRHILFALDEQNPRDDTASESPTVRADDEAFADRIHTLYHNHLPHLADVGCIEWDCDTNTVTRGPRFEDIEPLLRLMQNQRDDRPDN